MSEYIERKVRLRPDIAGEVDKAISHRNQDEFAKHSFNSVVHEALVLWLAKEDEK